MIVSLAVSAMLVMAGCSLILDSGSPDDDRLIADVQVVSPARFSYVVHVTARLGPVERSCAGTVIGRRWVLTAGHCLVEPAVNAPFQPRDVRMELSSGVVYHVTKVVFHPRYQLDAEKVHPYDLALLKLDKPVAVRSLGLAADEPGMNTPAMLGGWGCLDVATKPGHDCRHYPAGLKTAQVSLVYSGECGQLADGEVCLVRACGMSAARPGDSGGPVIVSAGKRTERLVAVIAGVLPGGDKSMTLPLGWIRTVSGIGPVT
jgi:secreted trypsin-like serine protease